MSEANDCRVTIGRHSYHPPGVFEFLSEANSADCRIEVGAFCSIASNVSILGGGEHIMERPTTFPVQRLLFAQELPNDVDARSRGVTKIGNDVWIGYGAIILSGVSIGDGAVIGAGAVVAKSVPPYAITIGNPAFVKRYRFDAETRRRLLALRWWDWADDDLEMFKDLLIGDVETFLKRAEEVHVSPRDIVEYDGVDGDPLDEVSFDALRQELSDTQRELDTMRATRAWRAAVSYWRFRSRVRRRPSR